MEDLTSAWHVPHRQCAPRFYAGGLILDGEEAGALLYGFVAWG